MFIERRDNSKYSDSKLAIAIWLFWFNWRYKDYVKAFKKLFKAMIRPGDKDRPMLHWGLRPLKKKISYTASFVDGKWTNETSRSHQEWDLTLSAMACGRVCGKTVNGNCPHPFELDQSYWLVNGKLPLFSTYRRAGWTPKFNETENIADADLIPRKFSGVQKYTINGDIVGWIVQG